MKLDKDSAADELAKAISDEVGNPTNVYESWYGSMCETEGRIVKSVMRDGKIVLTVMFDDHSYGYEQGHFELVLAPESWTRIDPPKQKRKTRAKDLRKAQRDKR